MRLRVAAPARLGRAERNGLVLAAGGPGGWGGSVGAAEGETRHQTRLVVQQIGKKTRTRRQSRHQTRQQTRHLRCIVVPMTRTIDVDRDQLCRGSSVHITLRDCAAAGRSLAGLTLDGAHEDQASSPDRAHDNAAIRPLQTRSEHSSFKEDVR